jgi:hypothetical protein
VSQSSLIYALALLAGLVVLKLALDRVAVLLQQQGLTESSTEYARISAFGLIVYSVMQDLRSPDQLLWVYWLLICCWFYVNNRG